MAMDTRYDELHEEMDELLTKTVQDAPKDFHAFIRKKILGASNVGKMGDFQLTLVVDTNILYSEVRSLMLNGSSFFLKIVDYPIVRILAPTQLKKELYAKIRLKFPKDKKTRELSIDDCLLKADLLLSKIDLNDKVSARAKFKATSILKNRDADDISFVALNFSEDSYGVLTNDKDIRDQEEVKTWKLSDIGRVVTEVNKGTFSFVVVSSAVSGIWKYLHQLITWLWSVALKLVKGITKLFSSLLVSGAKSLSKLPSWVLVIGGAALFIALFNDDSRKKIGNFFDMIWDELKPIIEKIKIFFKALWELFKELWEALVPVGEISVQLLFYFSNQSARAFAELEKLESQKV